MSASSTHHFTEDTPIDTIVQTLASDRLADTDPATYDAYIHPPHPARYSLSDFGFARSYIDEALECIVNLHPSSSQLAARSSKAIVIYSDYDADGVTGGAIMWETLHRLGFTVYPYIGDRVTEGYGMSNKGIDAIKEKYDPALIITVDHGISAREQVTYAKNLGIEVIVTDHHHRSEEKVPIDARAIFHIPTLSGSSTAYYVAKEIAHKASSYKLHENLSARSSQLSSLFESDYVGLAAIGTIADLVPLTSHSRSIATHGLTNLSTTTRPGIVALKNIISKLGASISTYEVGFQIAPRINASGRLDSALDALRLLCTTSQSRADDLAAKCNALNTQRQEMVKQATAEAIEIVEKMRNSDGVLPKILVVRQGTNTDNLQSVKSDTLSPWHEGIIGLIASKLLERYYRPVIVFTHAEEKINARGEVVPTYKASARSIPGLHLANLLQSLSHHLLSHGGHAAAAGLSMDTRSFDAFCIDTLKAANTLLTEDNLIRPVHADAHISITHTTNTALLDAISAWAPFGIGNSKPTFVSHAYIKDIRTIGASGTHLKLTLTTRLSDPSGLEGVLFGKAAEYTHLTLQDQINVVYTLDWNIWRGTKTIQAKIITLLSDEDKV